MASLADVTLRLLRSRRKARLNVPWIGGILCWPNTEYDNFHCHPFWRRAALIQVK